MLEFLVNYKLWKIIMEYVFGKEDLWDWIEFINNKESGVMSGLIIKVFGLRFVVVISMGFKNFILIC